MPFDFITTFRSHYSPLVQLSAHQAQVVCAAIRTRAPGCRFLVFGAGYDTGLWLSMNADGHTCIMESSEQWLDQIRHKFPSAEMRLLPSSGLTVEESLKLGRDEMMKFHPPVELSRQSWDVILVDGPPGYRPSHPGRVLPIAWAAHLADQGTHVFIDDYDRPLENKCADMLLRDRWGASSYIVKAGDRTSYRELFWSAGSPLPVDCNRSAVLSIATRDYAQRWRFCIDSQSIYCRRNGYEHHVIDPQGSDLHPKWAKLEAGLKLFNMGYDVLLVDADAEITQQCPPFMASLIERPTSDINVCHRDIRETQLRRSSFKRGQSEHRCRISPGVPEATTRARPPGGLRDRGRREWTHNIHSQIREVSAPLPCP